MSSHYMTDFEKSIMDKIYFLKDQHFKIGSHYIIKLVDSFLKKYVLFYAWQFSSFTFHQTRDITRVRHCYYVFLVEEPMTLIQIEVTFASLKISFHHPFIKYFVFFNFFYHKTRNKTKIYRV